MCMAGDEPCASSPLCHKEKVTGRHHPYASKPRTANASSSREKMVDDEDENISPTQMETNDEPRRDNFTVHEHGTHSNSEFTHPQCPFPRVCLNNLRSDSKGARLIKLTMWQNVQARKSNKNG
ncbi:hypothetical protein O181_119896 [Austropuccinia psidii MF-1]|uniref:Uncharacterized protein n=1 Tax=Austropuccinia psidii MF-1 TaxID=1389203 RepID=A0A9Q3KHF7_9BASI|nr:hypothetical protein [Austropuccinia psidii MF-1]